MDKGVEVLKKKTKVFLPYRVFTPATFSPSLDALPTVFGTGSDALVPLWIENKGGEKEELEGASLQQRPCKVSSMLSPLCLRISSSGTFCGLMVIGDRAGIFHLSHYPLCRLVLGWISCLSYF